jgi:hypothetical protein
VNANAEGQADLSALIAGGSKKAAYAWAAVVSPVAQRARIVIATPAEIAVACWLDGKPVGALEKCGGDDGPRAALIDLPKGTRAILIRITSGGNAMGAVSLVTTFVVDRPAGFRTTEAGPGAHAAERR